MYICSGEWWNDNVVDVDTQAVLTGGTPKISDAFTINGKPGDQYNCSKGEYFTMLFTLQLLMFTYTNCASIYLSTHTHILN